MNLFRQKLGSGSPLIILHGLFGSGDNWMTHARALASHFEVFLVDLRNHGHSAHHPEMNFDVMAEDLLELCADENLRDINLVGHSLGGKVALRFAQQHFFLIAKLVVVDIGIRAYKPHHQHIFDCMSSLRLEDYASRGEVEKAMAEVIEDQSTLQFLLRNLYWAEPGKLAWRFNLGALRDNVAQMTAAIQKNPIIESDTLFIRGADSNYILDADLPEIQSLVPHSKMETIPGAGHWVHAESPMLFRKVLTEFLG